MFYLLLITTQLSAQSEKLTFKYLTSNDGLSQNFVSAIYQDKFGFMWFGTKDGLNRYDGYEFKVYRHIPSDTTSLSGNFINAIFEDSKGRLWVGSNSLDLFIPEKDFFRRIDLNLSGANQDNPNKLNKVNAIIEDKNGLLWLGTNDGLVKYDPQTEISKTFYQEQEKGSNLSDNIILSLSTDDSLLFVGTQNGLKILNINSVKNNKLDFVRIPHQAATDLMTSKRTILSQFRISQNIIYAGTPSGLVKIDLSTMKSEFVPYTGYNFFPIWLNRILSITQDKHKNLWLACSGGLVIYNPYQNDFKYHFHNPKEETSLSFNSLTSLFADRGGKIWLGTAGKGINIFDQNKKEFLLYNGLVDKEPFKTSFSVSAVLSDTKNNLWISSMQNLFRYDRANGEYNPINLKYGAKGEITSIVEDSEQNVWVSSSGGLYKISSDEGKITYYGHNPSDPNSLRDNFVRLLFIDNKGNLYALNSNYLSRFNKKSNSFTHYYLNFSEGENLIPVIRAIYQTADGSIWFAWYEGLVKYDLETQEKTIFTHQLDNNKSISNNEVLTICEDPIQPKKFLWVGTQGGGLSRLNLDDNTFSNYSVKDGLPNNVVYGILSSGNELWLSTNNGLSRVTTDKYGSPSFRNYDVTDGLQGNEFNTGAYSKSASGELFFGGLNGVNAFYPSRIRDNVYIPPVVITEIKFLMSEYDQEVEAKSQEKNITIKSEITLPFSQNPFIIQFASLDYTATEKNMFKYKLKPIHNEWINIGTQRNVTFTELGSGEYEFILSGSNNDGIWNEEGTSLKIIITPPFWRSSWAYLAYAVLLSLILFAIRKYELNRILLKNRLKQESFETRKLKEIDEMKSGFFANISHEFRTPLTLILGPAEQLEQSEEDELKKEKIFTIKQSANRLLRLINQILDLSKLEMGKTKLSCEEGELVSFLKGITKSFLSIAEKKQIELSFESNVKAIQTYFDRDIIEKIFYNLLSNAFKFTQQGGAIEVKINYETVPEENSDKKNICKISVKDSGIGIRESELPKVFNKFYIVENINGFSEQGSGIGLAIVKELVELHKGNVTVESKVGEGSVFTVSLPIGKKCFAGDEIVKEISNTTVDYENKTNEIFELENNNKSIEIEDEKSEAVDDSLIVLIIEDDSELRKFIASPLKANYKIIEAVNGKEGCEKAVEFIPDLIISDIMMPEIDGYSACKKLRSDERTSHIPIILLTAKASAEDKLKGLEIGADDYLTKPFSSKELSIRVKNLIEIRQSLRKKFSSSLIIKPKDITTGSVDKLFLEKAIKVIEKNISNDKFSVEDFSNEMNLSHSQLHRKLKALVNQSANQFVRSIRMQRALELLQNNSASIAEIAYMVGFGDPSYFTKIFSKHFGYLPSDIKK
jgi:signal transduction histidine kinase/ligand-binding sensor domain-containing protein/DNA-binding response OmpR family regulator